MTKLHLLVLLAAICVVGYAKHVHPRHVVEMEEDSANDRKPITTEIDGLPIVSKFSFYKSNIDHEYGHLCWCSNVMVTSW